MRMLPILPQNVSVGSAFGYAFLPGIIPRLRSLSWVLSRFFFTFSQIFGIVGLIDRNHPCLQYQNIGYYRFTDVISLAFYNMWHDRKDVRKVVMFFATIGTLGLIAAWLMTALGLTFFKLQEAHAQYFGDSTLAPYGSSKDWAYEFLSEVFGNVGVSVWGGLGTSPPIVHAIFHPMLGSMFSTYSQALLIIAVFMIIYHIVIMVAESARTGTPFGQNFNSVWAPVRLAVAIGILVPVTSSGYNTAQVIAFQVSNWGSALATNVWNNALNVDTKKLIGNYSPTEPYDVMRGFFLASLCMMGADVVGEESGTEFYGQMWQEDDTDSGYKYFYFGTRLESGTPLVKDYCGVIKVPLSSDIPLVKYEASSVNEAGQPSPYDVGVIEYGHYARSLAIAYAMGAMDIYLESLTTDSAAIVHAMMVEQDEKFQEVANAGGLASVHADMLRKYRERLGMTVAGNRGRYFTSGPFPNAIIADSAAIKQILDLGKRFGWASAGSYMITISSVNSTISNAIGRAPAVVSLPRLLVNPMASPYDANATIDEEGMWDWLFGEETDEDTLKLLNRLLNGANQWFRDRGAAVLGTSTDPMTKVRISEWNQQLMDNSSREGGRIDSDVGAASQSFLIRSFIPSENSDVNPMARVIALGNNLNIVAAIMGVIAIAVTFIPFVSGAGFSSILVSIATMLIGAGYTLSVVLPLALFTNFMFAVIEWVISVFEAVLGMPLWALSFISVGGEGIGDKAMGGVMMLFEIMLRPTIIVISTVGSFLVFSGSVNFMDKAFGAFLQSYYATQGGGASAAMTIGSVFIYAMTMYSIGNSCFKMIPTIANNFMRWIGGPNGFSGTMDADMSKISGLAAVAGMYKFADAGGGALDRAGNKNSRKARRERREAAAEKAAGKADQAENKQILRDIEKNTR